MTGSIKLLLGIFVAGIVYSFFRAFTGEGGSGLYDGADALVHSSIILFLASLAVLLLNIRKLKKHRGAFVFLIIGLPLTLSKIQATIAEAYDNRTPDLSVKYELPVGRAQYLFDSTNIQRAIDAWVALSNREFGGPKIQYGFIDTIIYSQRGDKIFVSYIKKHRPNSLGNDLDPDYFGADKRDSIFWQLTAVRYQMGGSYSDKESLKLAVRKFYFNRFSFLDKDSAAGNYFWREVL